MTTAERIEVFLILSAGPAVWFLSPLFPAKPELRSLIGTGSVVLLAQGLIRDLWLIYRTKTGVGEGRRARCLCVESTVGVTGVIFSLSLLGLGVVQPVAMNGSAWTGLVLGTLATGFLIKDWVLTFGPLGLHREKDHGGVIVSWRR